MQPSVPVCVRPVVIQDLLRHHRGNYMEQVFPYVIGGVHEFRVLCNKGPYQTELP